MNKANIAFLLVSPVLIFKRRAAEPGFGTHNFTTSFPLASTFGPNTLPVAEYCAPQMSSLPLVCHSLVFILRSSFTYSIIRSPVLQSFLQSANMLLIFSHIKINYSISLFPPNPSPLLCSPMQEDTSKSHQYSQYIQPPTHSLGPIPTQLLSTLSHQYYYCESY